MKTFAVVQKIDAAQYFDGNHYAQGERGLIRSLGEVAGQHYGLYITCGGALLETAKSAAEEIGGEVFAVTSEYWPGSTAILEAIEAGRAA